jgi:hypothetical protein
VPGGRGGRARRPAAPTALIHGPVDAAPALAA